MSVRRVMGIETEYGISVPGQPWADPVQTSGLVVSRYAREHGLRATHGAWDYSDEQPLHDARGFSMPRDEADPTQLTDEEQPGLANVVLTNGARLYVDHAHPEYSSPEVMTPHDAVVHDRAGELVMREAVELLSTHADPDRYRRLHVIIGDANLADVANLLKMGSTSLVLALVEADAVRGRLALRDPLRALREVSHDPTCTALVELADGRRMTAVQLLWAYRELIGDHLGRHGSDEATDEVLAHLDRVLTLLESDPMSAAKDLDWVAKLSILQGYRDRDGLAWGDPRLQAVDIQYSDIRPAKGVFARLEAAGRITRLTTPEEVEAAVTTPPADTRAWLRGRLVRDHAPDVISASWDSVVLRVPRGVARISMPEPTALGRDATAAALAHDTVTEVVEALGA